MNEYEYEYYSGSEILPNMNIIQSATFDRIRIRILRLFKSYQIQIRIILNMSTKTIKKQKIPEHKKLHTGSSVPKITTEN